MLVRKVFERGAVKYLRKQKRDGVWRHFKANKLKKNIKMENYTEEQILSWKSKAEKWDKLGNEISKCYNDENGEYSEDNPEMQGDLCDIGEMAASAFGWL